MAKEKLMIPLLGMLPIACAPSGFESLEGFGDDGDDGNDNDDIDDADDVDDDDDENDDPDSGTDDGNPGPFELESAAFEDLDTLVLTFSNPLAAFGDVDPASFRISWGFATSYFNAYYGNYYESTRYWDPNVVGGYYGYGNPFVAVALNAGPADEQLRIEFEVPLEESACTLMKEIEAQPPEPPNSHELGLFVHHSAIGIPLRDTFGTDLPPTGAEWVEWPYTYFYVGGPLFTYLDPKIEIPCP
jgi:hypothetical protein